MSFREDSSISRQVREECAVLSWFVLLLAYSWSRSWPGRLLINGRRSLAVGLTQTWLTQALAAQGRKPGRSASAALPILLPFPHRPARLLEPP